MSSVSENTTVPVSYKASVTVHQAWEILEKNPDALLVDVRTQQEWDSVGCPNLDSLGKELIKLSWMFYPEMKLNSEFIEELEKQVPNKNQPLLFICRSGGRSHNAALATTLAGYLECYNVIAGFEGEGYDPTKGEHINGWKAEQLAWKRD